MTTVKINTGDIVSGIRTLCNELFGCNCKKKDPIKATIVNSNQKITFEVLEDRMDVMAFLIIFETDVSSIAKCYSLSNKNINEFKEIINTINSKEIKLSNTFIKWVKPHISFLEEMQANMNYEVDENIDVFNLDEKLLPGYTTTQYKVISKIKEKNCNCNFINDFPIKTTVSNSSFKLSIIIFLDRKGRFSFLILFESDLDTKVQLFSYDLNNINDFEKFININRDILSIEFIHWIDNNNIIINLRNTNKYTNFIYISKFCGTKCPPWSEPFNANYPHKSNHCHQGKGCAFVLKHFSYCTFETRDPISNDKYLFTFNLEKDYTNSVYVDELKWLEIVEKNITKNEENKIIYSLINKNIEDLRDRLVLLRQIKIDSNGKLVNSDILPTAIGKWIDSEIKRLLKS